jgi:WD40 repeat protein
MSWPLSQDYNEAIQSPRTSFSDPELQGGQVVVNALGLPVPCSGNFADVYPFGCPETRTAWAVKCFTREVRGLRERYAEISRYLEAARLSFTVDFEYLEQGIRIRGAWYPILKMRWVEGMLLNVFVRDNLDKPSRLEKLSLVWSEMAKRLHKAGMAHGDLQHGNVILVPGRKENSLKIKLIDYDGMFVPALAGKVSGEIGHPNYQHPQRLKEGTYSREVDRFPLLVVATALRAVAVGGRELWARYDNGDNMLFREQDLRNPRECGLVWELARLNDPELRRLVDCLSRGAYKPLDQTPLLEELVPNGPELPALPVASLPVAAAKPQGRPGQPSATTTAALSDGSIISELPFRLSIPTAPLGTFDFGEADRIGSRPGRRANPRWRNVFLGVAAGGMATLGLAMIVVAWATWPSPSKTQPEWPSPSKTQPESSSGQVTNHIGKTPTRNGETTPGGEADEDAPKQPVPLRPTISPSEGPKDLSEEKVGAVRSLNLGAEIRRLAWSRDGKQLLAGCWNNSVYLFEMPGLKLIRELKGHTGGVNGAAFFPDGKKVLSGGRERPLRLWDAEEGRQLKTLDGHKGQVHSVAISADGRWAASCGQFGEVLLWDLDRERLRRRLLGHETIVDSIAFSAKGDFLLSGDIEGTIRQWRVEDGKMERLLQGHAGTVYGLCVSGDGRYAVSCGQDTTIRLWSLRTGRELKCYEGDKNEVLGVALSPDGRRILSGGVEQTIRLWDTETGKELKRFVGHTALIWNIVFSPDGRYAVSGGRDKMLCLWRLPSSDVLSDKPLNIPEPESDGDNVARTWAQFDTRASRVLGTFVRINKNSMLSTKSSFSGSVQITVVARTESRNIRLHGPRGSVVIFNWELNPGELRVHRPDGNDKVESGSVATSKVRPLMPGTWYTLGWRITEKSMEVTVNGKPVFKENRKYDLSVRRPYRVGASESFVDVKSFIVRSLK